MYSAASSSSPAPRPYLALEVLDGARPLRLLRLRQGGVQRGAALPPPLLLVLVLLAETREEQSSQERWGYAHLHPLVDPTSPWRWFISHRRSTGIQTLTSDDGLWGRKGSSCGVRLQRDCRTVHAAVI